MTREGPIDVSKGLRKTTRAKTRERFDPCCVDELQARDDLVWYFLRTVPGQEFEAVDWLRQHRLIALTPVKSVFRHKSKWSEARKEKKVLRRFAAAPGYAAVAMPSDALPRWVHILTCPHIVDEIGMAMWGRPVALPKVAVERFVAMSEGATEQQRHMRSGQEFAVGQTVRIAEGPMEGATSTVVEINAEQARIITELFGAATTWVRCDALEKLDD